MILSILVGLLKARSREKKGHLADCTRLAELWRPSQRLPATILFFASTMITIKTPAFEQELTSQMLVKMRQCSL